MIRYKVVEVSPVTDAELEHALNQWSAQGWSLESIQFAMRDGQRRPGMAFILFVTSTQDETRQDPDPG